MDLDFTAEDLINDDVTNSSIDVHTPCMLKPVSVDEMPVASLPLLSERRFKAVVNHRGNQPHDSYSDDKKDNTDDDINDECVASPMWGWYVTLSDNESCCTTPNFPLTFPRRACPLG